MNCDDIWEAAEKLTLTIEDEGICPEYHIDKLRELKYGWPVLWEAIQEVMKIYRERNNNA